MKLCQITLKPSIWVIKKIVDTIQYRNIICVIKKYNMTIYDLTKSIDIDNMLTEAYINRANIYLILRNNDNKNLEEYLKKLAKI